MLEFFMYLFSSLSSAAKRGSGLLECGLCEIPARENRIRISSHMGKAMTLWKSRRGFYERVLPYQPQRLFGRSASHLVDIVYLNF